MRKRNIIKVADTVFWYTVYLFPILIYCIYMLSVASKIITIDESGQIVGSTIQFSHVLNKMGIAALVTGNNPIYNAFVEVFGTGGILPLLSNSSTMLTYLSYVCSMFIVHLMVDVVLFIPRFAMKWMDEFTKE